MSAVTSDLLSMWTQASPKAWMLQLTAEAASTLAILLIRDQRWSEAAAIYETFVKASQVITRQSPSDRLSTVTAATSGHSHHMELCSCVELLGHVSIPLLSFDCIFPSVLPAAASCCSANTSVVSLRTQLAICAIHKCCLVAKLPPGCIVACYGACCMQAAAVAGLTDGTQPPCKSWHESHADYNKQVDMLQVVLRPLWNAAVVSYRHLEDKERLYQAWCWMEAHAQDWVPSQQSCYIAMLRAVTALHHRPMQGLSCTMTA